jgi:hypothetical protein
MCEDRSGSQQAIPPLNPHMVSLSKSTYWLLMFCSFYPLCLWLVLSVTLPRTSEHRYEVGADGRLIVDSLPMDVEPAEQAVLALRANHSAIQTLHKLIQVAIVTSVVPALVLISIGLRAWRGRSKSKSQL